MTVAAAGCLGRFELRRKLGSGAQASVWLAHDPRLDREVAVKLLDRNADSPSVSEWLHEARAVSRLNHPHIVPVFEADREAGQAYLVFEYVDGPTLAEALRRRAVTGPREAATLMLGVLDALAAAHAQGIVHRDLKPSNILLGADGRARVMDFGIAARSSPNALDGCIVGTPGYISPEAARGAAPAPTMDVFSAGLVLGEMLAGVPLLKEDQPSRALDRVQREDLTLPATPAVDDTLRAIVQRALARDIATRYPSAQAMRDALAQWLQPAGGADPAAGHGTLDFLLRRMRNKGDFPVLSESVVRIHRVATSESESLGALAGEILKDVALTNKLLRMVNTVQFSGAAGTVSTVSRAAALVGFAGIRNMALSLVLLEHMRDKEHAAQLKDEFVRALLAGALAEALTQRDGEEAFLGSMFQNLGRLLAAYYLPEEALQIRQLLPAAGATPAQREAAAVRVLGIAFDELGVGIARSWGLPETLQRAMRAPVGETPPRAAERGVERQRWAGRASNEIADAMLELDGPARQRRLGEIAERYAPVLAMPAAAVVAAAETARKQLALLAPAMGLQAPAGSAARRLLVPEAAPAVFDSVSPHHLAPTLVDPARAQAVSAAAGSPQRAELLAAGIQDVTEMMVADDFRLNEVLRTVLQAMHGAFAFTRIVFCLRDPKSDQLTGRFGLGDAADAIVRAFRVPLRASGGNDLFAAVCAKGIDTLIADTTAGSIGARLPEWYRRSVNAPAFLLLPMMLKGAPFALIYADKSQPGAMELGDKELAMLRTLRNQAVMAFRQRG